jgi:phosphatidylglycerol---prolipoprotein diacylglyceryl transferase
MFAAIPFFGLGVYTIEVPGVGPLPLDPWAILVAIGFIVGLEISRNRAIRLGLDVRDVVDGAVVTVLTGFVLGHVYTVLFYFPERLETEGIWAILRVWSGFSSVGGFFGAVVGSVVFYGLVRRRPYFRFADVISFGFPFGWFFGRVGCGFVHDHIGIETTMPWGMDFDRGIMNFVWVAGDPYPWADGVRHELGLYEAVFMIPVMALFLWLGRRDRFPGFFTLLFFAIYAPIRFGLDFLRANDATYGGLTPAQYGLVVIFVACVGVLVWITRQDFVPWPLDGEPDQQRRALEAAGRLPAAEPEAGEHDVEVEGDADPEPTPTEPPAGAEPEGGR